MVNSGIHVLEHRYEDGILNHNLKVEVKAKILKIFTKPIPFLIESEERNLIFISISTPIKAASFHVM